MKKFLLLLCTLLGTVGAWAETITWESKAGWTQATGGKAGLEWFGAITPGSTTTEFTLTEIQIMHEVPSSAMDRYLAIATDKSTTSLGESAVVAVSNNHINPSAAQLYTYTFDNAVTLQGGTTYYIVFLTSNVPSNGAYTVGAGRLALNHTSYGTYSPGCSYSGGSTWWPYYKATLTTSVQMINVTYKLYESDGTTFVSSEVASQEPNSAVSIPSALSANTYFTYSTEGTVGSTDCEIKVIRTPQNGIVYPISNLSNDKAYKIVVPRGTYTVNNGKLANTVKNSSYDINYFALISYEDHYYMWSIEASKFVAGNGATLSDTPVAIQFNASTVPSYQIKSDSKTLNATAGFETGAGFDNWSTHDDGNRCVISAVEDFNPTSVIRALEDYFHPTVQYVISDASGVIYTSEAISTAIGETISELPADLIRSYCTYNVTPATMEAGSNTVNATVTYNPPFKVSSSFESATWYYAKLRGSKYVRADESHKDGSGRYLTNTTNERTDVYKWAFVGNPYNLAIMNKGAGSTKYLNANNNTAPLMMDSSPASDIKARWIAVPNSNGSFALRSENGANLYINDAGGGGNLGLWNSSSATSDNGSNWVIEEDLPVCEVTYTYTYGGNTYSSTEVQNIGNAVSLPADINFPYTNYTFDTQTVPDAASATVNVTVEGFNMPFTASTDYASATWYYLQGHASYNNYFISTNGIATVWATGNGMTDAYQWAFIGNPIEGIKVINKAAGNGKYLTDSDNATTMTTTATVWVLKKQTATNLNYGGDSSFGLWSTAKSQYANCAGGVVKYWGSFDAGSTFWCEAVPDNYASNVEAEIKPWFDTYGGNFKLKSSVVEANQSKYEAALVNCDLATYQELTDLIADANNYVFPETGFYRIKSIGARAVGESYIAYGKSNGSSYYGLITKAATAANQDATTVFYINKQSNGKYTMAIQGLNVQAASKSTIVSATSADAPEFTFIPLSPGYAAMTVNGGQYEFLHESGWTESGLDFNAVLGWTADADASQWTVEAVETLTVPLNGPIDGSYYATLCLPFDATITGATAYTLTVNVAKSALTMTEVTDGKVPAGTPVFLKGTAGTATATINTGSAFEAIDKGNLTGTYVDLSVSGDTDYFLGKYDDKVGFYHWTGSKLKANRAYLEASKISDAGGNVKGFALDFDSVDAIE